MKKHVLAAIAASSLFAGTASAADLPARTYTKAPPAVAVAYDWTGFYIGGNVGGIWQDNSGATNFIETRVGRLLTNPQNDSISNGAVFGGVHAGYNWQVTQWVFGVEADWDWTGVKNSFCRQTDTFSLPCADNRDGFLTYSEKTEWLASVRGRLGFAWDRVMVYATGGAAWGDVKTSINANCLLLGCGNSFLQLNQTVSFSDTRTGWVAGAGIETMLTPNWCCAPSICTTTWAAPTMPPFFPRVSMRRRLLRGHAASSMTRFALA
ncbi:outer membrane protein [Bradyrhizobium sp. NAS80.1]|uniref:outer membrane protein n=1 Tax=Bradyrhizobium sp. NAS80.1 TaxID=1680159 RepID=UPI000A06D42C|nr:outer membrane protein [Bradyrhizobium sp. NAS80.1]